MRYRHKKRGTVYEVITDSASLQCACAPEVESPFGWACPDCEVLQEAARIVRGEPGKLPDLNPEVVLSNL